MKTQSFYSLIFILYHNFLERWMLEDPKVNLIFLSLVGLSSIAFSIMCVIILPIPKLLF